MSEYITTMETTNIPNEQLRKIKVSGFKSIKDCELSLGQINVIIGGNNSGKSNLISVFSLLQEFFGKRLQEYVDRSGANQLFYKGKQNSEKILIETHFGQKSYEFSLVLTSDKKPVVHYAYPVFENPSWLVYHFRGERSPGMSGQEKRIIHPKALRCDGSNLADTLYFLKKEHKRNYKEIVGTIQLVFPRFSDFLLLIPSENGRNPIPLKWFQKDCDVAFSANHLSDGMFQFICLATLLLQPQELQPTTIIIDEPELGLSPYSISILAELIKQATVNKQIIIATQSADLLDRFAPGNVIVAEHGENGSEFKRPDDRDLALWFDEGYTMSELWKKNILGSSLPQ